MKSVELRFDRKEFEVRYDPAVVSMDEIFETIRARGFAPSLTPPATPRPRQSEITDQERARLDVRTISHGAPVRLAEHLVRGKVTIFDYYADWCGPCLLLARDLEQLMLARPDVAVRKIDIVDWKSEAARQATREFRMPGLPYVRVYDPAGELMGEVSGNDIARIRALLPEPR